MANYLERQSILDRIQSFQNRISNRTGINTFDADSKVKAITDVLSEQLIAERQDVIGGLDNLQISTARGVYLDKIGSAMGLPRYIESFGQADSTESSIAFFVSSGTFGNLNSGSNFTIPKGTLIWSEANENDAGFKVTYSLLEDVVCISTSAIVFASARCTVSGIRGNVGTGVLTSHNYTKAVSVTNLVSILNARERETDQQYRFRLSQYYATVASLNETKLKLVGISVPGVIETKVVEAYYGIGTVALVVLGTEYQTNEKMIRLVNQTVSQIKIPGIEVYVVPAVKTEFSFALSLKKTRNLSTTEENRIKTLVNTETRNYLRGRGLGGTVNISELATILSRKLPTYVQLFNSNISVFDEINFSRDLSTKQGSLFEILQKTQYTLDADEFAEFGKVTLEIE